jgi:hypothetical protein
MEERLRNHFCRGKAISIIHPVCLCKLSYRSCKVRASYCIVVCGLLALPKFSLLSYKQHHFRKIIIEQKMYVFIFSTTLFKTFLVLRRTERDIVINV